MNGPTSRDFCRCSARFGRPETKEMLSYIDVLVDGEFIEEEKNLTKRFKGSANQRTIDVPASLKEGRVVIVEGYE